MGRPSEYTQEKAAEICARLAEGESLRSICASDDMPDMKTVYRWIGANDEFRQQYALAREDQADTHADGLIDLSDTATPENHAAIRLQIDTRKWVASKLKPKKYGDKTDHNVAVSGKLMVGWLEPEAGS